MVVQMFSSIFTSGVVRRGLPASAWQGWDLTETCALCSFSIRPAMTQWHPFEPHRSWIISSRAAGGRPSAAHQCARSPRKLHWQQTGGGNHQSLLPPTGRINFGLEWTEIYLRSAILPSELHLGQGTQPGISQSSSDRGYSPAIVMTLRFPGQMGLMEISTSEGGCLGKRLLSCGLQNRYF